MKKIFTDFPGPVPQVVSEAVFVEARRNFHISLLKTTLTTNTKGIVSNADGGNKKSCRIAEGLAGLLSAETKAERLAGQTAGKQFEMSCADFLENTFKKQLAHLRPGRWNIDRITGSGRLKIANYEQYKHLVALEKAARDNPELASALGNDYTISPDVVIARNLEDDATINEGIRLVDASVGTLSSLRKQAGALPMLHASISCKWTLRSDRAQNARLEALNLIRNRKGRLPHIAIVTAEPLPTRLASLALGTGDFDCVYHFALPELIETVKVEGDAEDIALLRIMVDGRRLKDISDLPLDLAC